MKKLASLMIALCLLLTLIPTNALATEVAVKTTSKVTVDGAIKCFDAYTINQNNYFKLRDLAFILSGTAKQFEVTWDGNKNAINLLSNSPYTKVGGEMVKGTGESQRPASLSNSKIYMDGKEIKLMAYTIEGNNYFKLRDLGSNFDFGVECNEQNNNIAIESMLSYLPEDSTAPYQHLENTQPNYVERWANISSVQQFAYKNEGLAYAYAENNNLQIVTPSKQLTLEMKFPLLGDVLSDDNGNFYIVWGRENKTDNAKMETVFISKYSSEGQHIKTTGFVGKSSPWGDEDSAKTKIPFDAGNCVSVIGEGILVCYHSKERYDGHQSDNVIAVNISDMSPYQLPNDTFSGHSFNQSLICSKLTSGFLFASHGDAYARGFRVNNSTGKYGNSKEILFHFYLESNSNYNMRIVNETSAQLGGLAETSKGVLLVGASAKSIGEEAKTEKQNLFFQLFNPRVKEISPLMFVGGTTRTGATSFDINDKKNSPLTKVTDYGVHWLTNYTDTDVIAPQVVTADDRVVIFWATQNDTFYMVLSANGDVLTPAKSLGGMPLNSYERPVYHNGAVYWVYAQDGKLRVRSIQL